MGASARWFRTGKVPETMNTNDEPDENYSGSKTTRTTSEQRLVAAGDPTVGHYISDDGRLSLEGDITEWIDSDTTAADLLDGDS